MKFITLLALIPACTAVDLSDDALDAELLPTEQAAIPISPTYLELGVTALDRGEQVSLQVRGAAPGATVWLLRGAAYGPGACPPPIAPSCLSMQGPVAALGRVVASAAGDATLTLTMPPAPVGLSTAFQAVTLQPDVRLSEPQERVVRPAGTTDPYGVGATWQPVDPARLRPDILFADTIGIAEPVTVSAFICQGRTLGGFFRSALYDDAGDRPGNLMAESGAIPVSVGPNRGPNLSAPVVLTPGRYWLATVFEGFVETWDNGLSADNPEWVAMHNFYSPMPDPLFAGVLAVGPRIACSVEVQ